MTSDLSMYVAPGRVRQAQENWLERTLELIGERRWQEPPVDFPSRWLSPELLLSQTCGYPLVTSLRGKVRLIGRPSFELPHSFGGYHCSLILCRTNSPITDLAGFSGSHGLINADDSNSGMNLFRHTLSKVKEGRFFSTVSFTGAHRESIRRLKNHEGDLASIDSVTYDYLDKFQPEELKGLKIIARSDVSPCLPYITSVLRTEDEVSKIRFAMNEALKQLPEVAQDLAIKEVLPASEEDYEVLLQYELFAVERGFSFINE